MKCPNIQIIGVPEEEDKKKGHEKILEEVVENLPKMREGNSHPSPRNPESPKQDKPKAKHTKTHLIKLMKIKHKEQILKAAREKKKTNNTQGGFPQG